jgi:ATPase family AAA domain-containing protein 2
MFQSASRTPAATAAKRDRNNEESSDFHPEGEDQGEDDSSESEEEAIAKRRKSTTDESIPNKRTSKRLQTRGSQRHRHSDSEDQSEDLDRDELAEEAMDLQQDHNRRQSQRVRQKQAEAPTPQDNGKSLRPRDKTINYSVFIPGQAAQFEEDQGTMTPGKSRAGLHSLGAFKPLWATAGPFGGGITSRTAAGLPSGGNDDDSSDEDTPQNHAGRTSITGLTGIGSGLVGMTPTTGAMPPNPFSSAHSGDPQGEKNNLGKIKSTKDAGDIDPLGIPQDITFDAVGGLDDHINQLKEMVMLPLLYPELFQRLHVTPPRGVLFHGPPGTGKTLLARALASTMSQGGRKVTFYMRKGADALSKWVGEAERQLRLLFEDARKNQPSIIFFDEIDGLAPVRSSKQEQIHSTIVATLLALMDGMDNRGQVIVIGATNRPDSIDPAFRRPGRLDREFYFGLPDVKARRSIIEIHTKGWKPELAPEFKDQLAEITNGYAGADLRALCTEAAINAIQGTYPQVYKSDKKLIVDPNKIKVLAKDFMISVNKNVPSSQRTGKPHGSALPKRVEPLLRKPFNDISRILDKTLPTKRKRIALEEAEYDDRDDTVGFARDLMEKGL